MKEFKIWIKDDRTMNKVLEKLTKEGYTWINGRLKPKNYLPHPAPIGFCLCENGSLTWLGEGGFSRSLLPSITPEKYLGEDTKPIVIYRNDSEVIALDKNTGEKAVARCNPSDKFDFNIGAKLAFDRLINKEVKTKESNKLTLNKEIKKGDKVKVIDVGENYSTYEKFSGLAEFKSHYIKNTAPNKHTIYIVKNIQEHDDFYGTTIAVIQNPNTTQVFLIRIEGIEKV